MMSRLRPERLRNSVHRATRMTTGVRRALPDFVIVGAQKAGTTSLHAYLLQHPQIFPGERKEVHYFDLNFDKSELWYRSHFPRRAELERNADAIDRPVLTGEASPYYLAHPHAAERIARLLPDARIIVLLRDPVTRAYSHYRHNVRKKEEQLPFVEALAREAEIMPAEARKLGSDPNARSRAHQLFSYRTRGHYAEQLERYFAHCDRDRILILRSEDFFADAQAIYSQVLRFLGIDQWRLDASRVYNIGRYERGPIPGEAAQRAYFEPHNRDLYAMIGRDMGW